MARPKIDRSVDCERLYRRMEAARVTAVALCKGAKVHPVTLSRGYATGQIGIDALWKLEAEMSRIEAGRKSA